MNGKNNFLDLSHCVTTNMPVFPGYPQPVIEPFMTYAQAEATGRYLNCSCQIDRMSFVSSTGTYMDAPGHFFPHMKSLEDYSLAEFIMAATVLDCRSEARADEPININRVRSNYSKDIRIQGRALLLETGWADYWGRDEYFHHPFLDAEAVEILLEHKPALVGIDTLVIDDKSNKRRPAHCGFLENEIFIVENLNNLNLVREMDIEAYFIPLKIKGLVSMPVRAFARQL